MYPDKREPAGSKFLLNFYNAFEISIHINPIPLQLFPRHINLHHQLLMRLRYIIEREDAPPQLEEEIGTQRHKGPERKLLQVYQLCCSNARLDGKGAYDGYYFVLDGFGEGNYVEEAG